MKITVKIDGESYDVEIGNLYQRPVIATVEGVEFEVWPEGEAAFQSKVVERQLPDPAVQTGLNDMNKHAVLAPIPGVIFLIKVEPGEEVLSGQELCVLEAMKMKNVIRAPRDGVIVGVLVCNGQQVNQGDVLVKFDPQEV